jgi:4-amino-4-deoxy-L-arabinose transferase-like glycosyltransferase
LLYATALRQLLLRFRLAIFFISLALTYVAYTANLKNNPPGFYVDESSIAFNAYTISETGSDEYGQRLPVYFRAFGEYKNPVYIYLLAAVFKITKPGNLVARLLSGTLGFAAALLVGLLAFRLSASSFIACFAGLTALATPWLFEISRLVFEVALLPLTLLLFLLALQRAQAKKEWRFLDSLAIAFCLGLFTYTYSICRFLGPLLAIGLVFFINKERWKPVAQTCVLYALTLIPLGRFAVRNPGALTTHFDDVSYISANHSLTDKVWQFLGHYFTNLNLWEWLAHGDQRARHHVEGIGSLLVVPLLMALAGAIIAVIYHRNDSWWRFVGYGLAVSVVPASLTNDDFHSLRLSAFPVFLLLLMVPALQWMSERRNQRLLWRWGLMIVAVLTLLQALLFQRHFHSQGVARSLAFDADYRAVFQTATASSDEPIYLPDTSYAHAYWLGVLEGIEGSRFIRLADHEELPGGALVIRRNKTEQEDVGQVIHAQGRFIAYRAVRE